jgi:hypothetical protein
MLETCGTLHYPRCCNFNIEIESVTQDSIPVREIAKCAAKLKIVLYLVYLISGVARLNHSILKNHSVRTAECGRVPAGVPGVPGLPLTAVEPWTACHSCCPAADCGQCGVPLQSIQSCIVNCDRLQSESLRLC